MSFSKNATKIIIIAAGSMLLSGTITAGSLFSKSSYRHTTVKSKAIGYKEVSNSANKVLSYVPKKGKIIQLRNAEKLLKEELNTLNVKKTKQLELAKKLSTVKDQMKIANLNLDNSIGAARANISKVQGGQKVLDEKTNVLKSTIKNLEYEKVQLANRQEKVSELQKRIAGLKKELGY